MSDIVSAAPLSADAAVEGNVLESQQPGQAPAGSVGRTATEKPAVQPSQDQPAEEASKPQPKKRLWEATSDAEALDKAEKDYRALQAAYTRGQQALSKLGATPEEAAEALAFLAELKQNPSFREWGEKELARRTAGGDDPQTIEALRIVQQEAQRIADEAVAPLREQAVQQKIANTFTQMDSKHGPEWRRYQEVMGHLVQYGIQNKWFPPDIDQHFSLPFIDGIYRMVAAADPEYVPRQYEKMLKTKQSKSTSTEQGAPSSALADTPAKNFDEAARQAMRQLGLK